MGKTYNAWDTISQWLDPKYSDIVKYGTIVTNNSSSFEVILSELMDPNYVPEDRSSVLFWTAIGSMGIALVFAIGRIWARSCMTSEAWAAEDFTLIASTVVNIGYTVLNCFIATVGGVGRHIYDIGPETLIIAIKLLFVQQILYPFPIFLTKISLCLFYLRLLPASSIMRKITIAYIIYVIGFTIVSEILFFFGCVPVGVEWDLFLRARMVINGKAHCVDPSAMWISLNTIHVITDIIVLLIPMPLVWKLRRTVGPKRRMVIICLFGMGSVACFVAGLRVIYIPRAAISIDITWDALDVIVCTQIETTLALIIFCVPALRPFMRKLWSSTVNAGESGAPSRPQNAKGINTKEYGSNNTNGKGTTQTYDTETTITRKDKDFELDLEGGEERKTIEEGHELDDIGAQSDPNFKREQANFSFSGLKMSLMPLPLKAAFTPPKRKSSLFAKHQFATSSLTSQTVSGPAISGYAISPKNSSPPSPSGSTYSIHTAVPIAMIRRTASERKILPRQHEEQIKPYPHYRSRSTTASPILKGSPIIGALTGSREKHHQGQNTKDNGVYSEVDIASVFDLFSNSTSIQSTAKHIHRASAPTRPPHRMSTTRSIRSYASSDNNLDGDIDIAVAADNRFSTYSLAAESHESHSSHSELEDLPREVPLSYRSNHHKYNNLDVQSSQNDFDSSAYSQRQKSGYSYSEGSADAELGLGTFSTRFQGKRIRPISMGAGLAPTPPLRFSMPTKANGSEQAMAMAENRRSNETLGTRSAIGDIDMDQHYLIGTGLEQSRAWMTGSSYSLEEMPCKNPKGRAQ